jgi:hypothetical protein
VSAKAADALATLKATAIACLCQSIETTKPQFLFGAFPKREFEMPVGFITPM